MVWVTPGKLPANVIVAPNSPSARAQHSTAPANSDGAISGSVTRVNTRQRLPPQGPRGSGEQRWRDQRERDSGEHPPTARAQGTSGFLVASIHRAEARFHREDEKRH